MDVQSFEIFAEVSVALFGFSGLAAVVGGSKQKQTYISVRIRGLLFTSGVAAICSIAPLTGLNLLYCSVLYIVLLVWTQYWAISGFMRQQSSQASWMIYVPSFTAMVVAVASLLYGILLDPSLLFYAYMYGICVMLVVAGIFFIRMVLSISTNMEDT